MYTDFLIVGAGLSGCVLAERIATQTGKKVILIDRRNHICGNVFDFINEYGIIVQKYGPHIFHTNSKYIFDYLSQFTDWYPYNHRVLGVIDGKQVPIPFNLNSLHKLFANKYSTKLEYTLIKQFGYDRKIPILKLRDSTNNDLKFLADYIYDNIYLGYTRKQWGMKPEDLSASVIKRVPIKINKNDNYFDDIYQKIPIQGYFQMFKRMINHDKITTLLNTNYCDITNEIKFKYLIFTGPIDEYFNFKYGELPYRSMRFRFLNHTIEWYQCSGTVNYPNDYKFLRITENKRFLGQFNPNTTITIEFPQKYIRGKNNPCYPILTKKNNKQYELYFKKTHTLKSKVIFIGRLAEYRYYDMDEVVGRALSVFYKRILQF